MRGVRVSLLADDLGTVESMPMRLAAAYSITEVRLFTPSPARAAWGSRGGSSR